MWNKTQVRSSNIIIGLMFLFASLPVASEASVVQIRVPGPVQESTAYKVQADGQPLTVQRCDGRSGPASYVHVTISEPTTFAVICPEARGKWDLSATEEPAGVKKEDGRLSFVLNNPSKMLVQTGASEFLYIIADRPESLPEGPHVVSIEQYGATPSTEAVVTQKIQKGIDELAAKPNGGVLFFPPGIYRTGTISIKSKVTVYLSGGARLQGTNNPADYPMDTGKIETGRSEEIFTRLVLFDNVKNAALCGLGELDGGRSSEKLPIPKMLPNLIRARNSHDVRIEGVTLRRSCGWCLHILYSDGVLVRDMKSFSHGSDGLDVDNSSSVTVEDVLISSHDDAFVFKSTADRYGPPRDVTDVTLRNAVLWTVKSCIKIGTETNARVMGDYTIEDVTVAGARGALVMYLRDGALIKDVRYRDIRVKNAKHVLEWIISKRNGIGRIENIEVSNIRAEGNPDSILSGYNEDHGIRGIKLIDFIYDGKALTDLKAGNFKINSFVRNVEGLGMELGEATTLESIARAQAGMEAREGKSPKTARPQFSWLQDCG